MLSPGDLEMLSTAESSSGEEMSTADKISSTAVQLPTRPTAEEISSTAEKMSFRVTEMLLSANEESSYVVPSNTKMSMQSTASRYLSSSWTHLPRTEGQQHIVTTFSDSVTVASTQTGIPNSHNSTNLTSSVLGVVAGGSGSPAAAAAGVSLSPMAVQFVIVGALFGTVLLLGLANVLLYLRRTGQMRRTIYSVSHLCDRRIKHHHNQRETRYNCRRAAVTGRGRGNVRNNHRTTVRMKANHSPFVC